MRKPVRWSFQALMFCVMTILLAIPLLTDSMPRTSGRSVSAASAAIPPAPWQLTRLPFDGTFAISQGPQATACRSIGSLSHFQGDANGSNERAIDIAMGNRTPIYAAGDGVIQFEGWEYGMILIRLEHPGGLVTWYVHLSQTVIDHGSNVTAGQLIGYSGDIGAPGAFHLHFAATQGASYGSPSIDLRGMPGFSWNENIVWNDDGFISNCAALSGQNDGSATGGPPPSPPSTVAPVPPTATRVPPTPTTVSPSQVPTMLGGFSIGSTVRTTARVNMRSGPDIGAQVLFVVASGTQCSVLARSDSADGRHWYQLDCGSARVGWVSGKNLRSGSASAPAAANVPITTSGDSANGNTMLTTAEVNMRSGPDIGAQVLFVVASGTQCSVLARSDSADGRHWYQLDCGSARVGWVSGKNLKSSSANAPAATSGGFAVNTTVETTAGNLKMRSDAGTNNSILYTLSSGVQCTVLGGPTSATDYQWYWLDCGNSRVGWVVADFLRGA